MTYNLFFDGFEDYANYQDLNLFGYDTRDSWQDNLVTILPTGGRRGGACVRLASAYGGGLKFTIPASTHVVFGAAINTFTVPYYTTGPRVIEFLGGGNIHAQVVLQDGQPLILNAAGVQVAQSSVNLPAGWVFLELGVSVANSGGTFELRGNGSTQGYIPQGIADTQAGSSSVIDQIRILGHGGGGVRIRTDVDDMYVMYGNELKWLGDVKVIPKLLTANATPQDWTPNTGNAWERMNAGDGYIASATPEAVALFDFADSVPEDGDVLALCVRSRLLKDSAGTRTASTTIKSGAAMTDGIEKNLSTQAASAVQICTIDPDTGNAWSSASLNAAKVGVKVKL